MTEGIYAYSTKTLGAAGALSLRFFIPEATELRGHWQDAFERRAPLHLELGCGKGTFIAALGRRHPEVNYLAVDMIDAVLGLSKAQRGASLRARCSG